MNRSIARTAIAAIMLMAFGLTHAVAQCPTPKDAACKYGKMSAAQKTQLMQQAREKYPLLFKRTTRKPLPQGLTECRGYEGTKVRGYENSAEPEAYLAPTHPRTFAPSNNSLAPSKNLAPSKPKLPTDLWGYMLWQEGWDDNGAVPKGVYSFVADGAFKATPLYILENQSLDYGSGIQDGVYYLVGADLTFAALGLVSVYLYGFDTTTWEPVGEPEVLTNPALLAFETAQDFNTGIIYGQFYSADMSGLEFGTIDYKRKVRTTIAPSSWYYVAMGVTSDGYVYGISADGYLYNIDTHTGEETLVGDTGIRLWTPWDTYYTQSGEIDQQTDTFYWSVDDSNGRCALYTVDLGTALTRKVADTDNAEIVGMAIPQPLTSSGSPAAITDLSVSFDGPSLTGTATFTLPTKTYGGDKLAGQVSYTLLASPSTLLAQGTGVAGQKLSQTITVAEGMSNFLVYAANGSGESPRATVKSYVGYDTPLPPTNVQLDLDTYTGDIDLTWEPPTDTEHHGYMGPLTYNVYRYEGHDQKLVAEGIADCDFSETIEKGTLKAYRYAVQAVNTTQASALAESKPYAFGQAKDVPYVEDFKSRDDFFLWTTLNLNGDEYTWTWFDGRVLTLSSNVTADDWLISPALNLRAGVNYTVSYTFENGMTSMPTTLAVSYGKAPTAEAMTTQIVAPFKVGDTVDGKVTFKPTETGIYYIGFHDISDANMWPSYFNHFSIEAEADDLCPAAVQNLNVTPEPLGELRADISFTAPQKSLGGEALTGLTHIDILRDNHIVHTFTAPTPGQQISYTDNTMTRSGHYTYTILAYNDHGYSPRQTKTAFVGTDKPQDPAGLTASDHRTSVQLSWQAVPAQGVNGGNSVPSRTEYAIYRVTDGKLGDLLGQTRETTFNISLDTDRGDQQIQQWAVCAVNPAGSSNAVVTTLVTGAPYTLPFDESFPNAAFSYPFWWSDRQTDSFGFFMESKLAADDDNGSVGLFSYTADVQGWLRTGKIALAGAVNPQLAFSYYTTAGNDIDIDIEYQLRDGTTGLLKTFNLKQENTETSWHRVSVPLSNLVGQDFVILSFHATPHIANAPLYIDHVVVSDVSDHDLAANLLAPDRAIKGTFVPTTVKVSNVGLYNAESYTVSLFANGQLVEKMPVTEVLEPNAERRLLINVPTSSINRQAQSMTLRAEVDYASDLFPDNDAAEASVALLQANVPAPTSIQVTQTADPVITWTATASSSMEQTEDFEAYAAFQPDDIAPWQTIDKTEQRTYYFNGLSFPSQGEPFAWMVFDPSTFGIPMEQLGPLTPHSGSQYLISFCTVPYDDGTIVPTDHWLISPMLDGSAQQISFFAGIVSASTQDGFGPETLELYYSLGGTDTKDFVKATTTNIVNVPDANGNWGKAITMNVPKGTKYFAIRHVTADGFTVYIDDISYRSMADAPVSFRVYRGTTCIATVAAGQPLCVTDHLAQGETYVRYSVTAVYADGAESEPVSADWGDVPTGIYDNSQNTINNKQALYDVQGRRIGNGYWLLDNGYYNKGVIVSKGKKQVLKGE